MGKMILAVAAFLCAADYYPQARALIQEAEKTATAAGVTALERRSDVRSWAARLYASGGYLEDAARVLGKSAAADPYFQRARAIYGELPAVERETEAIVDHDLRASRLLALADLVWKMGDAARARKHLESARLDALKIPDPVKRKKTIDKVEFELKYLTDEPPMRISAKPQPWSRTAARQSVLPAFPITTGGFRNKDPQGATSKAHRDEEFLQKLFGFMAARDHTALANLVETAGSPFQKILALASIEHIMIQTYEPKAASALARQMPESDADCLLAKAEALASSGAAWSRKLDDANAKEDFALAAKLVRAADDLPLGKVAVMVTIADGQCRAGLKEDCRKTLEDAIEIAQALPPTRPPYTAAGNRVRVNHYRYEAYSKILDEALYHKLSPVVSRVSDLWIQVEDDAGQTIAVALADGGQLDAAIDLVRRIAKPAAKISAMLELAESLLNHGGVPTF